MAYVYPIQANFSRGELNPRLHGRVDIEHYKASLFRGLNWIILKQGGLRRRQGTKHVHYLKDSSKTARLLPFIFGTPSNGIPQAYVLEMGDTYSRPFTLGGIVTTGGGTPTAITNANPAVVTLNAHGFANGDRVLASSIGGMAELNNREFTVAGVTTNTFQLSGINSSAYGAFTSGGTFRKIVEFATPYAQADLPLLDYAQTADTLTVTHLGYQPREITRTSDTAWSVSTPTFKDGPYFDEPLNNAVTITPNITGAIHPQMTSNTTPSGTITNSDAATDAYLVFNWSSSASSRIDASSGNWTYTPPSSTVVNSYWIQCDAEDVIRAPASWVFQGYNGTSWVDIDSRNGEAAWAGGEKRFYDFDNVQAFSAYRLLVNGTGGAGNIKIAEMGWGFNGDYAPTMTLTFSASTNINDGTGFDANDIGRNIRFRGSDGKWRWFLITGVTSTLIVTGRMYGYALPNVNPITKWRLGAWRAGSWPAKVSFFQSRRCFARTIKEPYTVWMTQTFDFYDFGVSDPMVDDDGITIRMLTGRVNGVRWLADAETLAVGTTDNIRVIDRANKNTGFGATNIEHQTKTNIGGKEINPVPIQSVLLYADYYGKTIREFVYDYATDGYTAADVTLLSDHLLSSSIVEMAYQQSPDSIVWIVTGNGHLVSLTYDRDQKIVGMMDHIIAGTDVMVESVACIPGTERNEVYIIVKRTVAGQTQRTIEQLAAPFENMALADAVLLDGALTYSGAATGTVTGLWHRRGETVNVLADGIVYRGLTVSATGSLTLPNSATAAKITVGLGYSSVMTTLPLSDLSNDGVHLGRRSQAGDVFVSVMDALGLKVSGLSSLNSYDVLLRDNAIDPAGGAMVPRTGIYPAKLDTSWRENSQFTLSVDDPVPCTIRAVVIGAQGDP